ncbi:MAG TPA: PadR family transcriptional regulator [Candidatus Bathyarchaeia archaeon]|nr:PadR family transcriptional regulator [Candidatus Bathyarchaeia archaeon]
MPSSHRQLPAHLQELIPLTPAVFFILFALADGEKHGYAIMQEVSALSDEKVRMGPGTLYTTIQRLLDLRLIEQTSTKSRTDSRRVYYRLTRLGKLLLEAETARLDALVRLAHEKGMVLRNAD